MKDLTRVVVLVSLLGLGSVARAQGVLERGTSWVREDPQPATLRPIRSRASHRERAYGSSLAAALGQTTTGPVRVTQRFAPDSAPGTQVTARGVRVALGDATEVDRLFFPDAQAAFLYALYAAETDGPTDAIVEARGNQVVVVRSTGLGDPERTADLLDAAWGSGIPTPKGVPTVSATLLDDGAAVIVSRRSDPILDDQFQRALDASQRAVDRGDPQVEQRGSGDDYSYAFDSGRTGSVANSGGILIAVVANSPEQRALLEARLAQVVPATRPADGAASGYGGATSALDRAFE